MHPLELIGMKQKVGSDDANTIALPILLYLDAAKRGQADISIENSLVRTVVLTQVIGGMSKNRAFYDVALAAGKAIYAASARGAELMSLTTGEYRALKAMVAAYLRVLPSMEISLLARASAETERIVCRELARA